MYLKPTVKFVRERRAVSNPANASVRELALSVPTFQGAGPGGNTSPQGDAWFVSGDGAQAPVLVKVLSKFGENPVRLKLIQGVNPPDDAGFATVYELEKVIGGWKILSMRKGPSSELLVWPME